MTEVANSSGEVVTEFTEGGWWWCDLSFVNFATAQDFYSKVFGWRWRDNPPSLDDSNAYHIAFIGEHPVAGAMALTKDEVAGKIPPHWNMHVTVSDIEASAARVTELGGQIYVAPFEIEGAGKLSVACDPQGAVFYLWEAGEHKGATLRGANGTLSWQEAMLPDIAAGAEFYTNLLGNTQEPFGDDYVLINNPRSGKNSAGILKLTEEMQGMPACWNVYFSVDDLDATLDTVRSAGGEVIREPMVVPGICRFAVCADPEGAPFCVEEELPT